jgi:ribonuclease HI
LTEYAIVFDGGSLGNPGRGYGTYRLRVAGRPWEAPVRCDYDGRMTNNEAEYRTLIAALEALLQRSGRPEDDAVEVLGDSQLVLRQLAGAYKVRAANLRPYYGRARELLDRFGASRLTWHPRADSVALLGH